MIFCVGVVERATEPFVLPLISPQRMYVCRISAFSSRIFDDSISQRASVKSPQIPPPAQMRSPTLPAPSGPRPRARSPAMSSADDLLIIPPTKPDHARSQSDPGPTVPEPIYQSGTSSNNNNGQQYIPHLPHQSSGWKDDWSVFAGEAGLRRSGASTTITGARSDFTVGTSSTESTATIKPPATQKPQNQQQQHQTASQTAPTKTPAPPAPYTLWTPFKPTTAKRATKHSRSHSYKSVSSSGRPLLPTVAEIMTPLTDSSIDDYLGPWSPAPTVRAEDMGMKPGTPIGLGILTPPVPGAHPPSPSGSFKRKPVGARPMKERELRTPKPLKERKWKPVTVEEVRDEGEVKRPVGPREPGERRRESKGKGKVEENEREMKVPGSFVE